MLALLTLYIKNKQLQIYNKIIVKTLATHYSNMYNKVLQPIQNIKKIDCKDTNLKYGSLYFQGYKKGTSPLKGPGKNKPFSYKYKYSNVYFPTHHSI